MKQLTGADVGFLNLETATSFGHVSSLSIYGRPDGVDDFDPYVAWREQLESHLKDLEPLRRRLVAVPFGLDRPYWIADPDFDLDFHVRHVAVPGDGNDQRLGDLVGRLIGRPMDRTKPLWESYVIEGLPGDDFAILTKIHHATIDGAAGAEMMAILNQPSDGNPDAWQPDRIPTAAELLGRTAVEMAKAPRKALRLQVEALSALGRVTQTRSFDEAANAIRRGLPGPAGNVVRRMLGDPKPVDQDKPPLLPVFGGPSTPFNAAITAHRRFAFRSARLEHIKQLKNASNATINDVVMAICAGALRRYLLDHDALPTEDLVAMVPVSIRTGEETDKWSNRVSAIFAHLPTTDDSPASRVAKVHESMIEGKGQFDLMPADMLMELSEFAPPALATRAARLAARTRLADRTNPAVNLVVSNVPGPRTPLGLSCGAPLKHYYPVSTVIDGQGLNITVQSYVDTLDFGLVACRELVPDLWVLADYCIDEISVLAKELGVKLAK